MNKREYLNDLLNDFDRGQQVKINKIIGALQKTEDILMANKLYLKVLDGELDSIKDKAIDNLIEAFNGVYKNEDNNDEQFKNNFDDTKIQENLISEIESLKAKIQELTKENNVLKELTLISNSHTLIDVPEEDINELYIRYMKDGTTTFGKAFIANKVIPKSYYKL